MGACGGGYGSLDPEFARRVELELVLEELRDCLAIPPSREVIAEERRRETLRRGRPISYRELLLRLAP